MNRLSYCPFSEYTPAPKTKPRRLFRNDDAGIFHGVGQAALRLADAVLDVHGGQVHVARYVKGHGDLAGTVIPAGGK